MLNPEQHEELILLDPDYRELFVLEAYDSFWDFCLFMDYEFFYVRGVVLEEIANYMQALLLPKEGYEEIDKLNISLPPRAGKSYLCTLYCDWVLGRFPKESIMRNTVTKDLCTKFTKDLIDILDGQSVHRGKSAEVFNVSMNTKSVSKGIRLDGATQGVSYFGAGVMGSIIGFGASILSILDDSVKDEFDAMSVNSMNRKWGWYSSAMKSRQEKGCKELFIGTRWSLLDIVGNLIDLGLFDTVRAHNITVPALIDGKSYCEAIESTEKFLEKKMVNSEAIWEAEYMQNPIHSTGLLFPKDDLNFFDIDDLRLDEANGKLMTGDTADEGADSMCAPIAYQYNIVVDDIIEEHFYIVDVVFTTDAIEITQPLVAAMIDKYQPDKIRFESNNGGKGYSLAVNKLIKSRVKIKWKPTVKNKHTRIMMKSGIIKQYFYFRNDNKRSKEYIAFLLELMKYSKSGKNIHDDAADGLTMLAELTEKGNWGWKQK